MQTYIESKGCVGIQLTDEQNILWLLILLSAGDMVILVDNAYDFLISLTQLL